MGGSTMWMKLRTRELCLPPTTVRPFRPVHRTMLLAVLIAAAIALQNAENCARAAEVTISFVRLGMGVPALIYQPSAQGTKAAVAVVVMHPEGDYLTMPPCTELSKRGYTVLCANTSVGKPSASADFSMEKVLLELKLAVAYLRTKKNIRKIVLLGHSGGGALMSAYEDIAENGVGVCQAPAILLKCSNALAGLPPADGLIMLDSNYGLSTMMILSLDGAVTNQASGRHLDPALNIFSPANGFSSAGSTYSTEFVQRWQKAVGQRNNWLIDRALERQAAIRAGNGLFDDDEIFIVPGANYGAFNNKLFAQDPRLLAHTVHAWPLIRKDGTSKSQVVHSVRVPENADSSTGSFKDGALQTTVTHFLGSFAMRTTPDFGYDADHIYGVDWTSSYSAPSNNVRGIKVPLLAMGMTAHWEFLAAEMIYDNSVSKDKSIAFVEGATHLFATCTVCEKSPGQFGDTMKTTFDYVDGWLSKPGRF